MSKRFMSSLAILLLPVGLVVLLALVASQWNSHSMADKQAPLSPGQANGVWQDIATFPAAVVSPTPGSSPLKIKRAAAAGYFPNGKVYMFGGRQGLDGEDTALRWIWEYNPATNTWAQKS